MAVDDYAAFLESKRRRIQETGPSCKSDDVHPFLHEWQREIVAWAVRTGRAGVWADTGLGKAQPTDEVILTPTGWRPIGDLAVGDSVVAADGKSTAVIGVYPQGIRPIVKVTFNDGSSVRCDKDHLWTVATDLDISRGRPWRTLSTQEIMARGLMDSAGRHRWRIPVVPRKVARCADRKMVSIDPVGMAPAVCIAIEHPSHLYVSRDYIVTHNTLMQIEWARLIGERTLIVAPLAVCAQTVREAAKVGVHAEYVRADPLGAGIWVTNYEMIEHFDPAGFDAVVLDEASILKQSDGKTRTKLIEHFADVPYRLACTATPAPNDTEELTNQAAFLGVSTRVNMLAAYFVHDDAGWRVKGHARWPLMRWMATWAIAIRKPSDLGYDNTGYDLPGLDIIPEVVHAEIEPDDGQLFAGLSSGVGGRASMRRQTVTTRCERAIELVTAEPREPWLLWCGRNDEADLLTRRIPGAVNVQGSMSPEDKAAALLAFADGEIRVLVTKPSLAAFGMNFQHCARMAFVGLSDSYEQYYQAIRRCYRYGQTRPVHAHIVLSAPEAAIAANVRRKEHEAARMTAQLIDAMCAVRLKRIA